LKRKAENHSTDTTNKRRGDLKKMEKRNKKMEHIYSDAGGKGRTGGAGRTRERKLLLRTNKTVSSRASANIFISGAKRRAKLGITASDDERQKRGVRTENVAYVEDAREKRWTARWGKRHGWLQGKKGLRCFTKTPFKKHAPATQKSINLISWAN